MPILELRQLQAQAGQLLFKVTGHTSALSCAERASTSPHLDHFRSDHYQGLGLRSELGSGLGLGVGVREVAYLRGELRGACLDLPTP